MNSSTLRPRDLAVFATTLLTLSSMAHAASEQSGPSSAVVMQGFHWNSPNYTKWYQTLGSKAVDMKDLGITHVWFPPAADSNDANGYLPRQLNILSNHYGSYGDLQAAISAFNGQGIKSIADIVINHRVGTSNWADFTNPNWSCSAVTNDDDWYSMGGGSCGSHGANDTGKPYGSARDLDHTNLEVKNGVTAWMTTAIKNAGFTGLRYDFAYGYRAEQQANYTDAFAPDFCVAEIWTDLNYQDVDAHRKILTHYITGDGSSCLNSSNPTCGTGNRQTCATFDFTTHGLLLKVTDTNEYGRLKDSMGKPAGAIGLMPQYQVTFVDNHDTGPSETCNNGQHHWPMPCGAVMQGYAYILTHPGIPTVYYAHVYDWNLRAEIKPLLSARKAMGVTSTSTVDIQQATNGLYAAVITGTSGFIAMKIGPNAWNPSGTGWTAAASGTNYAAWTKPQATGPTTTVRVHSDVGVGNTVSLRGSVAPLSWTTGTPATLTAGNVWVWSTTVIPMGGAFEFKPVINDNLWADGANYAGTGGQTMDITPTFPDAGSPQVDAGVVDAGPMMADAGPSLDAGSPTDAGMVVADAGSRPDAGTPTDGGTGGGNEPPRSCGCGATGGEFALAALLAAISCRAKRSRRPT